MAQEERSAVLVVRVWREAIPEPTVVRGRITMTTDGDAAGSTETAVSSAEELLGVIRDWLIEFSSR